MGKIGLQHQNLDQKVYQALRTMIVERELTPGTKIFQDKLAQELGVSRTPLVNALKRLEHERLVTSIPRRGYFIRLLSKEEMIQVFELREVLEGLAARRAARCVTDSQLEQFQRFFQHVALSDSEDDLKKYAEEDRQFHRYLLHVGENELLTSILDTYNVLAFSYQGDRVAGLIRSPQETIKEHLAIIEAICARNPGKAEAVAREHLANSVTRLRQELSGETPNGSLRKTPDAEA